MPRVYIHELVDVLGTERARYQHHMTANWSPEAGPLRRQRCFGVFSVVGSTGRWPQVLNLWEYDSWSDLAHNFEVELVGAAHRDPMLAEWWERAASMRTGGTDRILVAHDDSPGVQDWSDLGGTGAVAYLHDRMGGGAGTAVDLLDEVMGAGRAFHAAQGMDLVAAWRVAMAGDDEVIALWAVPDWPTWARYEALVDAGSRRGWRPAVVTARRRLLLVDAELSPLRTGRQPVASDRRPLDDV